MRNAAAAVRIRRQRASRLSRDLMMRLSTAWMAVKLARTLARKLETVPPEQAARLAEEIAAHIDAARKALSRASLPALPKSARRLRAGRTGRR